MTNACVLHVESNGQEAAFFADGSGLDIAEALTSAVKRNSDLANVILIVDTEILEYQGETEALNVLDKLLIERWRVVKAMKEN